VKMGQHIACVSGFWPLRPGTGPIQRLVLANVNQVRRRDWPATSATGEIVDLRSCVAGSRSSRSDHESDARNAGTIQRAYAQRYMRLRSERTQRDVAVQNTDGLGPTCLEHLGPCRNRTLGTAVAQGRTQRHNSSSTPAPVSVESRKSSREENLRFGRAQTKLSSMVGGPA